MKTIIISEKQLHKIKNEILKEEREEVTFYQFRCELQDFLKSLLEHPVTGNIGNFWKSRGFSKNKMIEYLIKIGILEKDQKVNTDNIDGPQLETSYKILKHNFDRKIKRMYIKLFEGETKSSTNLLVEQILTENAESKNMSRARKYARSRGKTDQEAMQIVNTIRQKIPKTRISQFKYVTGLTRMYIDGQIDASNIQELNKTIEKLSRDHNEEYDHDLKRVNDTSSPTADEIINRFRTTIQQDGEQDRTSLSKKQYQNNNNNEYTIIPIKDGKEASKYSQYTKWCVTKSTDSYDNYTNNGIGLFYFLLKQGYQNVLEQPGDNAPLDEYGLSMVAVSVDMRGDLHTSTCRWNHDYGGTDHIMTTEQISDLIGRNFYNTFPPRPKEEIISKMNFDEYGFAILSRGNYYGVINQNLEWVVKPKYKIISKSPDEFGYRMIMTSNSMWGLLDKNYKIIIEPEYGFIGDVQPNGTCVVYKDGKKIIKQVFQPISKQINENIDPSQINLSSFQPKSELNPRFFDENGKISKRARLRLLEVADDFIDELNLPFAQPKDIHIVGSIVGYNWSKYSDVDLHIIYDFNDIDRRTKFVREYCDSKKTIWNEDKKIRIYGYDVELYVEDIHEPAESNGRYSLESNEWIQQPVKPEPVTYQKSYIRNKSAKYINIIDKYYEIYEQYVGKGNDEKITLLAKKSDALWCKIKGMRKLGLNQSGEMNQLNIIYKVLRRSDRLEKLLNLRNKLYVWKKSIR